MQWVSFFLKLISRNKINKAWKVLTHPKGETHLGEVIAAYDSFKTTPPASFISEIKEVEVFYWSSYRQYQNYIQEFPEIKNKIHCCGLGKTYQNFKESNITVTPFSGMAEFKNWAKLNIDKE